MENVLTLIAAPGTELGDAAVKLSIAALADAGGDPVDAADWLAAGIACDIYFSGIKPDVADAAVRQFLQDIPVDIVAQPSAHRRKKLLVADMDSTMIAVECIDEIADFAGLRAEITAITERAMRGELDFSASLIQRAAMLKGLSETVLQLAFDQRVRLTPGARRLVTCMRRHGAFAALVSGGFTFFTSRVKVLAGFDFDQANTLVVSGGRLTGEVTRPILDPQAKLAALERLMGELGLKREETLAVGDGANDIPMIQAAGLGTAYHAKPLVAAAARARIDHGDLTALLYIQGYRAEDIAGHDSGEEENGGGA